MRTAVWRTAPRLPSGLRLRSAKSRRCGCRAADCLGMLSLRRHLTLAFQIDILLDGRIYIQRSTRSFLDYASEFSSISYQGKSVIQVIFTRGVGLVIVTDVAFPLRKAVLLRSGESTVFVKTIQVTAA